MEFPQYDVFSGRIDRDAIWLETVDGLGAAVARMPEGAKLSPGFYFVFCSKTHSVLAFIDTPVLEDIENRESA